VELSQGPVLAESQTRAEKPPPLDRIEWISSSV
jgi:hypothetical protein